MVPMKIFALETDEDKLEKSFLSPDEEVILRVKFSGFLFVMRTLRSVILTLIFVAIGVGLAYAQLPVPWIVVVLCVFWFFMVFLKWVTAYIDWRYDMLTVTTEEVVWVDQSSLFHVHIRQMNMDNIASVSAETQYLNLFPFGKLHFDLKEGTGKTLILGYIPHAQRVASIISDGIVRFQRRRAAAAASAAMGANPQQVQQAQQNVAPTPPEKVVTDEGLQKK